MLYVHIPKRRAALMDSADSILKHLVFKKLFRFFEMDDDWADF